MEYSSVLSFLLQKLRREDRIFVLVQEEFFKKIPVSLFGKLSITVIVDSKDSRTRLLSYIQRYDLLSYNISIIDYGEKLLQKKETAPFFDIVIIVEFDAAIKDVIGNILGARRAEESTTFAVFASRIKHLVVEHLALKGLRKFSEAWLWTSLQKNGIKVTNNQRPGLFIEDASTKGRDDEAWNV